jgi:hypothetical protein
LKKNTRLPPGMQSVEFGLDNEDDIPMSEDDQQNEQTR